MEKVPDVNQGNNTEHINFHETARERAGLRKTLRETPEDFKPAVQVVLDEADAKAKQFPVERNAGHLIKNKYGEEVETIKVSKSKKRLKSDKEKAEASLTLDISSIEAEIPQFVEIDALSRKLADTQDFEISLIRKKKTDPYAKTLEPILATVGKEKSALKKKLGEMEKENQTAVRAYDLVSYKTGLSEEGHIARTPSVQKYEQEIATRMISGKPMFLHGPTGTGKTSLARYSAKHLTGNDSEMVYCNPQTRESHIWGKTGIKPTSGGGIETVDIFGPLAKAAQDGRTVIFDEFTALPTEQMVFIKGVFNAKSGDTINVVGNGKITIAQGFQMIFTANLKSDKNPERQALPPEIAREFEQNNLEVGYTPKAEAYDIMLARLMNPDGSVDMSVHDLDVTLPKLCEAMTEVQMAYTDKESEETARLTGTMTAKGTTPGLKKLVLTQGTVEAILDAWKTEKQINPEHQSFAEFLDRRFQTTLTFKEYPEADRVLTAKILASKGFLRTLSEKELGLPEKTLDFDAGRKNAVATEELKVKSTKEIHNSLTEIAKLDPFETRGRKIKESADDLLGPDTQKQTENATNTKENAETFTEMNQFLLGTYKGWGVGQVKLDTIQWKAEIVSPASVDYGAKKQDVDVSKYGEYVMNPDTVDIDWDAIPKNKIKTLELPANMNGKNLAEIGEYIKITYSSKYKIPGLEYYKYIYEHPDKAPDSLKDGNYHFFFGSFFRDSDGDWRVPCALGASTGFNRDGDWLDSDWNSLYRVVVLER